MPADDQVDAAQAPAVARKVIQDEAVIGVVGPIFGSTTNAVGPLYTDAHVAMLTMGTAAELRHQGWTMFRVVPNDDLQARPLPTTWPRCWLKKIAVIDDGTQYGHGLGEAVKAQVKKNGGEVVAEEAIDPNADDYSSTIAKLMANGAEAVFLGASVNTETVFNRQLRRGRVQGRRSLRRTAHCRRTSSSSPAQAPRAPTSPASARRSPHMAVRPRVRSPTSSPPIRSSSTNATGVQRRRL